jgi:hypothetical protein
MSRLFAENGFHIARLTWNRDRGASVYVFVLGVRDRVKWSKHFEFEDDSVREAALFSSRTNDAGHYALGRTLRDTVRRWLGRAGRA